MTWRCEFDRDDRPQPIHVYPEADLREHDTSGRDCWCCPEIDHENGTPIIIHNSGDGREHFETRRRLPS